MQSREALSRRRRGGGGVQSEQQVLTPPRKKPRCLASNLMKEMKFLGRGAVPVLRNAAEPTTEAAQALVLEKWSPSHPLTQNPSLSLLIRNKTSVGGVSEPRSPVSTPILPADLSTLPNNAGSPPKASDWGARVSTGQWRRCGRSWGPS